jgi:hypothetical protein
MWAKILAQIFSLFLTFHIKKQSLSATCEKGPFYVKIFEDCRENINFHKSFRENM